VPCLAYLLVLGATGAGDFGSAGWGTTLLLAGCGIVTAVPLLFFGAAAVRVPLTTLGTLQYLTPTLQFLLGVLVYHETVPPVRWVGFSLIWLALIVLTAEVLARPPGRDRPPGPRPRRHRRSLSLASPWRLAMPMARGPPWVGVRGRAWAGRGRRRCPCRGR
jgi:drug/metabolite transporter (DMT)-like permease